MTLLCLAWTAGTKSRTSAYCGGDWDDLSPDNARITVYKSHGTKAGVDLGYMNVWGTIRDVGVALRLKRFQCSTPRACKDQPEAKDWFGPLACHRRSHIQRTFTVFLSRLSARRCLQDGGGSQPRSIYASHSAGTSRFDPLSLVLGRPLNSVSKNALCHNKRRSSSLERAIEITYIVRIAFGIVERVQGHQTSVI